MSLRFPLVFFNEPPHLAISSIIITKNLDRVVAGSYGGLCVMWAIVREHAEDQEEEDEDEYDERNDEQTGDLIFEDLGDEAENMKGLNGNRKKVTKLTPCAFLSGHETVVTAMTECIFDFTHAVCSVSLDGSLCVWNLLDGRCMAVAPYILSGPPICVSALPGGAQVACAGRHSNIEIVDLNLQKVICTLEGHTEWITGLSCGALKEDFDVRTIMLSVSKDATLRYWSFKGQGDQMPVFSVDSHTDRPLTVAHSFGWAYILIVSEDKWMVFTYHAISPIFETPAPENKKLKGGMFIDNHHILIYTEVGDAYVYELPKVSITRKRNRNVSTNRPDTPGRVAFASPQKLDQPLTQKLGSMQAPHHHARAASLAPTAMTTPPQLAKRASVDPATAQRILQQQKAAEGQQSFTKSNIGAFFGNLMKKKSPSMDSFGSAPTSPTQTNHGSANNNNFFLSVPQDIRRPSSPDGVIKQVKPSPNLPTFSTVEGTSPSTAVLSTDASLLSAISTSLNSNINNNNNNGPLSSSVPKTDYYVYEPVFEPQLRVRKSSTAAQSTVASAIQQATRTSITGIAAAEAGLMPEQPPIDKNESATQQFSESTKNYPKLVQHLEAEKKKPSITNVIWKCGNGIVLRVHSDGTIKMWNLIFNQDAGSDASATTNGEGDNIEASADKQPTKQTLEFEETAVLSMADGWSTSESDEVQLDRRAKITASQFSIEKDKPPRLVHGYSDGSIIIFPSVNTEQPVVIKRAHSGKVTSLLVASDFDKRLLISGSADYTIKIWDMSDGKFVHAFHYHSAPVTLLFTPPTSIRKKLQNCFCSVGEDRSVILYSLKTMECIHILGGHTSTVIAVYWRVDLDYLLVRCVDGSVYVWQLTTGLLERKIRGQLAASLIEQTEGPGSLRKHTVKMNFAKQSAYSDKQRGFLESVSISVNDREPDIQCLIMSMRRIIAFIYSERANIEAAIRNKTPLPAALETALEYIFQYGEDTSLSALKEVLSIGKPRTKAYFGVKGASSTYTLIVPSAADRANPFMFSPVLSAMNSLSCVSLLNALSNIKEIRELCLRSIDYYLKLMPRTMEKYQEPSLLWCSQFLKETVSDIQVAARAVMSSCLERLTLPQLQHLADKLSQYLEDTFNEASGRKQNLIVTLAFLIYKAPKAVSLRNTNLVAAHLIDIVEKGGPQHTTAISLLGEGFATWHNYIPDTMQFAHQLFKLSLPALLQGQQGPKSPSNHANMETTVAADALQAFVQMSSVDPALFVRFITETLSNPQHVPHHILNATIAAINPVMSKYPSCLINYLTAICTNLLKVLDPHFPSVRDACIATCTHTLRNMVRIFPMVSFHQEKQKLAVGNEEGLIIIYDMRTASKWQLFEAHQGPIDALAFSPGGDMLASYSPKDRTCRVWSIDGGGVLNLLGVANRSIKTFSVNNARKILANDVIKYIRLEWESTKTLSLRFAKNTPKVIFAI